MLPRCPQLRPWGGGGVQEVKILPPPALSPINEERKESPALVKLNLITQSCDFVLQLRNERRSLRHFTGILARKERMKYQQDVRFTCLNSVGVWLSH